MSYFRDLINGYKIDRPIECKVAPLAGKLSGMDTPRKCRTYPASIGLRGASMGF